MSEEQFWGHDRLGLLEERLGKPGSRAERRGPARATRPEALEPAFAAM
jgi:hypothetical protein